MPVDPGLLVSPRSRSTLPEVTRSGRFLLATNDGPVTVDAERGPDGHLWATLTSVRPQR
jgi:hypothetical protein